MKKNREESTIAAEKKVIRDLVGLDEETPIVLNQVGWTSRVYLVNSGEIVFKFPRLEKVKEEYQREKPAFKLAHELRSEIRIPEVKWEHPENNYLGYRGIFGQSLDEVISLLTVDEKQRLGSRIGEFFKRFHKSYLPNMPLISVEQESSEHRQKLGSGLSAINKHFAKSEVTQIEKLVLEEYPEEMGRLGFTRGLCHGDLGYWNIVYGRNGEVGIIDFGDVGYYDTSIDFAGMNDEIILDAALGAYGENVSRSKIALRKRIMPILDLPYFIGCNDVERIEKTVARIRKSLK
jgi:aminoglycoside phosphotransferase (APT) family kinase protein